MVENCFPLSFAAFGKGWPQFGCSHGAFDVVVLSPAAPEGKRTIEQAAGYTRLDYSLSWVAPIDRNIIDVIYPENIGTSYRKWQHHQSS